MDPEKPGKPDDQPTNLVPVKVPPRGFDPLKASNEDLISFAYPRRPPLENEAYEIWRAIVSGPLPPRENFYLRMGMVPDYQLSFNIPFSSGREETSQNWSGLVTHATGNNPFMSVFGMWQVPAVSAPAGALNGDFRCSTWIGIDGTRRSLPSLPQIGTTQRVHVVGGAVSTEFEAWSQWWALGGITQIQPFNGFPVTAGDVVACGIDVLNRAKVNVSVTNISQGTYPYIRSMVPIIIPSPGGPIALNSDVTGTTAEWIAERPRRYEPPMDLYPLPVFNRVTFTAATVTTASGAQRGLGPVKVIRMVEPQAGTPARLDVLSRARKEYLANGNEMAVVGPGLERQIGG